jgi:KDO2-lipid IV(A) lauroyltransferase
MIILRDARNTAAANINLAFASSSESVRRSLLVAAFKQLGVGIFEIAPLWYRKKERALSLISDVIGDEAVDRAYSEGNGVLFYTAHLGSWESLILYIATRWPLTVLYKPLKDSAINLIILKNRTRTGAILVEKRNGVRQLVKKLRSGECAGLLIDQNVDVTEGVFGQFFGVPACTTPVISRISALTKARIFGVYAYRTNRDRNIRIEFVPSPPKFPTGSDVHDVTLLNAQIETAIRKSPDQYWWFHRRFKARPPGFPSIYKD